MLATKEPKHRILKPGQDPDHPDSKAVHEQQGMYGFGENNAMGLFGGGLGLFGMSEQQLNATFGPPKTKQTNGAAAKAPAETVNKAAIIPPVSPNKKTASPGTGKPETGAQDEKQIKPGLDKSTDKTVPGTEIKTDAKDTVSEKTSTGLAANKTGTSTIPAKTTAEVPASIGETETGDKEKATTDTKSAEVKTPLAPGQDPGFQSVIKQVQDAKGKQIEHPDPTTKVHEAKKASQIDPTLEKKSLAGHQQVGTMSEQKQGKFDAAGFSATLLLAIQKAIPETEDKAKNFKNENGLGAVKTGMKAQVQKGKQDAGGGIESATNAPLNTEQQKVTPAVPLKAEASGKKPEIKNAALAAPKAKADAEISMEQEVLQQDQEMTKHGLSDEQLTDANEPTFTKALDTKNKAKEEARKAPAQYRLAEGPVLQAAQNAAGTNVEKTMGAFFGVRSKAFGAVNAGKTDAKSKDEAVRQKVATHMKDQYEATKTKVNARLNKLDADVNSRFDSTITAAQKTFEDNIAAKLDKYYSFTETVKRVLTELVGGLPKEVNEIFTTEKKKFIDTINPMLNDLGRMVESALNGAMEDIQAGKKELETFWKSQSPETQKVAEAAFKEFSGKYTELEEQVESKQNELADGLAKKYVDTVTKLQESFDKIKEQKKGWLDQGIEFIVGIGKTIDELKAMLLGAFRKAAAVVGDIVKHPIRFLEHLIEAIGTGIKNFAARIGEHFKKGFFEWLMGAMPAGMQFPAKWDLKGIFQFVTQFFELTWEAIKAKVAAKVGQPVVHALETAIDLFQIIKKDGLAGLWDYVKDKIGDLKTMVIDALMSMLESEVVKAGITWLLGILTPAGAFIKACQAIYNIISWFINNAQRIAQLINSIIDSTTAIVAGDIKAAAAKVEESLARVLPITLGFLAGLLGIGNLADRVHKIINAVKAPIVKAVDWVVDKAVAFAYKLGIPQMVKKGVGVVKGKVGMEKEEAHQDHHENEPEKQKKINDGLMDLKKEEEKHSINGRISHEKAEDIATDIRKKHSVFGTLTVKSAAGRWDFVYTASPPVEVPGLIQEESNFEERVNKIVGENIDKIENEKLNPLYQRYKLHDFNEIRRGNKMVEKGVPQLRAKPDGEIVRGTGPLRSDQKLIMDYDLAVDKVNKIRAVRGEPHIEGTERLLKDFQAKITGPANLASGMRAQVRRMVEVLNSDNGADVTGVEVALGGNRRADYAVREKDGTGFKAVLVEIKNWAGEKSSEDRNKLGNKLDIQIRQYIERGSKDAKYQKIVLEWIGFSKLDSVSQVRFKEQITQISEFAWLNGMEFEFKKL